MQSLANPKVALNTFVSRSKGQAPKYVVSPAPTAAPSGPQHAAAAPGFTCTLTLPALPPRPADPASALRPHSGLQEISFQGHGRSKKDAETAAAAACMAWLQEQEAFAAVQPAAANASLWRTIETLLSPQVSAGAAGFEV